MLKSSLCNYSDAYIVVKRTITVPNTGTTAPPHNRHKEIVFEMCASFIDSIRKLNNTQIDSAKGFDVVMNMYNLIEYSENFSQTS